MLQDVTCDSDGKIRQYVDEQSIETSLPVHEVREGEDYVLGVFLVGAYQEILGDMHNLFGDTASVDVELGQDGGSRLIDAAQGDTVADSLRYVRFEPDALREAYRAKGAAADLDADQRTIFLAALEIGLDGYTYLEP